MTGTKAVWSRAINTFLSEKRNPGSVVTHEWLLEQFELSLPDTLSKKDWVRWELKYLSYVMPFRDHLLKDHFIDLQPDGHSGFMVIPPPEQTKDAMIELGQKYKQIHKRCTNRLRYVNKDGLSQQEVQENADALARIANLKALTQPIIWWR